MILLLFIILQKLHDFVYFLYTFNYNHLVCFIIII